MSTPTFKRDDRVAYRAAFLRSIGDYSHASASRRGTVVDWLPASFSLELVIVAWDDGQISPCHAKNLILADRIHLEPA